MMNIQLAYNLKSKCLSDAAIASIADRVLLVSSKQLAKFLERKMIAALRSPKINKTGFKFYTDKKGNVYYNLIEVFEELGVSLENNIESKMPGKGDLSEESYLKKLGDMRADLEKIEFDVKEDLLETLREQFEKTKEARANF